MGDYDQTHFDNLYSEGDGDPWAYFSSEYERRKYERTVHAALDRRPPGTVDQILELGCGNGAFTQRLVDAYPDADVTGVDISSRALEEAEQQAPAAEFVAADMTDFVTATERGAFDLVFASECLYYVSDGQSGTDFLRLLEHLQDLVTPSGLLVSANIHRAITDGSDLVESGAHLRVIRQALSERFDRRSRAKYRDQKETGGKTREYDYEVWVFEAPGQ